MAVLDSLLQLAVERKASDLYLHSGNRPALRVHLVTTVLEDQPELSAGDLDQWLASMLPETPSAQEQAGGFAHVPEGGGPRLRVRPFRDRMGPGVALRLIPDGIPEANDLNLPPTAQAVCALESGLVLVTSPAGHGRSCTAAAMVDHINRTRTGRVITLEEPVELVHQPQQCLVSQRTIGADVPTLVQGLVQAEREHPEVIQVGELTRQEEIEQALHAVEEGNLVLASLPTRTTMLAVERLVSVCSSERQPYIRSQLAMHLRAVISQVLCRRVDGKGLVAAHEVLVITSGVADLIREGRIAQIPNALQTGGRYGMLQMATSLQELASQAIISKKEREKRAVDPQLLERGVSYTKARASELEAFSARPAEPEEEAGVFGARKPRETPTPVAPAVARPRPRPAAAQSAPVAEEPEPQDEEAPGALEPGAKTGTRFASAVAARLAAKAREEKDRLTPVVGEEDRKRMDDFAAFRARLAKRKG